MKAGDWFEARRDLIAVNGATIRKGERLLLLNPGHLPKLWVVEVGFPGCPAWGAEVWEVQLSVNCNPIPPTAAQAPQTQSAPQQPTSAMPTWVATADFSPMWASGLMVGKGWRLELACCSKLAGNSTTCHIFAVFDLCGGYYGNCDISESEIAFYCSPLPAGMAGQIPKSPTPQVAPVGFTPNADPSLLSGIAAKIFEDELSKKFAKELKTKPRGSGCECGADACGSPGHSRWCPRYVP